jgi:hypothetical protein
MFDASLSISWESAIKYTTKRNKTSKVSLPENLKQKYYVGDTSMDHFSWHISFHNGNR